MVEESNQNIVSAEAPPCHSVSGKCPSLPKTETTSLLQYSPNEARLLKTQPSLTTDEVLSNCSTIQVFSQ